MKVTMRTTTVFEACAVYIVPSVYSEGTTIPARAPLQSFVHGYSFDTLKLGPLQCFMPLYNVY